LTTYYLAHLVKYFAPNTRTLLLNVCYYSGVLTIVNKRKAILLDNYMKSYNNLCKLIAYVAENE